MFPECPASRRGQRSLSLDVDLGRHASVGVPWNSFVAREAVAAGLGSGAPHDGIPEGRNSGMQGVGCTPFPT